MKEERDFKGVWIPKEIWLNKNLTLQEKILIIEIDSLDNDNGCFASNKYFSEFFGIAESNISRLINRLKDKGWISIKYERNGKQIIKRIVRINRPPYPIIKMIEGYYQNDKGVLSNRQEGYYQIDKDNNISINNTINNKNIYIHFGEFKRIKLTQEEYDKLIIDYDKSYVDLVIERLDEYVESNNNKNKYKNFNLVIRKAIRERWFTKDISRGNTEDVIKEFLNGGINE